MHDHPLSPEGHTLAILDACVLIPPRLSDVLFDLHGVGLYTPHWTCDIETEFLRNWGKVVKDSPNSSAQNRLRCFQDATKRRHEVFGYGKQEFIQLVPKEVHAGDVHVISAALVLQSAADPKVDKIMVVTSNSAHMAASNTAKLGVEIIRPGAFIDKLCALAPERVEMALSNTVADLKKPPYSKAELLGALDVHGAKSTVRAFLEIWGVRLPQSKGRER